MQNAPCYSATGTLEGRAATWLQPPLPLRPAGAAPGIHKIMQNAPCYSATDTLEGRAATWLQPPLPLRPAGAAPGIHKIMQNAPCYSAKGTLEGRAATWLKPPLPLRPHGKPKSRKPRRSLGFRDFGLPCSRCGAEDTRFNAKGTLLQPNKRFGKQHVHRNCKGVQTGRAAAWLPRCKLKCYWNRSALSASKLKRNEGLSQEGSLHAVFTSTAEMGTRLNARPLNRDG